MDAFSTETRLTRPSLPWHALRTPVADTAAALAFTTGALGKLAADVQVLARHHPCHHGGTAGGHAVPEASPRAAA